MRPKAYIGTTRVQQTAVEKGYIMKKSVGFQPNSHFLFIFLRAILNACYIEIVNNQPFSVLPNLAISSAMIFFIASMPTLIAPEVSSVIGISRPAFSLS